MSDSVREEEGGNIGRIGCWVRLWNYVKISRNSVWQRTAFDWKFNNADNFRQWFKFKRNLFSNKNSNLTSIREFFKERGSSMWKQDFKYFRSFLIFRTSPRREMIFLTNRIYSIFKMSIWSRDALKKRSIKDVSSEKSRISDFFFFSPSFQKKKNIFFPEAVRR